MTTTSIEVEGIRKSPEESTIIGDKKIIKIEEIIIFSDESKILDWAKHIKLSKIELDPPIVRDGNEYSRLLLSTIMKQTIGIEACFLSDFLETFYEGNTALYKGYGEQDIILAGASHSIILPPHNHRTLRKRVGEIGNRCYWEHKIALDRIICSYQRRGQLPTSITPNLLELVQYAFRHR